MRIHREGYATIAIVTAVLAFINILAYYFLADRLPWVLLILLILSFGVWVMILWFFRVPKKDLTLNENLIVAPADGKVVTIEETTDPEYFKDRRLQISIFMSPLNVHQNLNGLSGEIVYSQYHAGKYLVAWHPKSSTENERHSVVYKQGSREVLIKQIAGAMARRIVNYLKPGMRVEQGEEMGFIKFGSRVDILLPPGTEVLVKLDQHVTAGITPIARW